MKKRLGIKVLAISAVALALVASGIVLGANPVNPGKVDVQDETIIFDTGPGTYPSIPGEHQGNFTPKMPMNISKVYTYSCPGTGGHTEKIIFFYQNGTEIGNSSWDGYKGDWHNLTFDKHVELKGNELYKYLIKTGSYPQIVHKQNLTNSEGTITSTEFTDANGRKYNNWIPAVKLFEEVIIPNQPPVALFSYEPGNPEVNQSVSFNASDSYDPDGEVVNYRWDFDGDEVVDSTGKTANYNFSKSGIYDTTLEVVDNSGASNKTSKEINVSKTPDTTPPEPVTDLNELKVGQKYIK